MPRLAAKYTVEGYLDDVARRSFMVTTKNGPENFRGFVERLGQISVKTYANNGSLLNDNQQSASSRKNSRFKHDSKGSKSVSSILKQ